MALRSLDKLSSGGRTNTTPSPLRDLRRRFAEDRERRTASSQSAFKPLEGVGAKFTPRQPVSQRPNQSFFENPKPAFLAGFFLARNTAGYFATLSVEIA